MTEGGYEKENEMFVLNTSKFETVLRNTKEDFQKLKNIYEDFGLVKSPKQLSEDLSGIMETNFERHYGGTSPKSDHEPDFILEDGTPIEIKCTSGENWRGGTFSKRAGEYILVSWELNDSNELSMFVCGTYLEESDWVVSKSKNYYATSMTKKALNNLVSQEKVTVYLGNISEGKRKNSIQILRNEEIPK